MAIDGREDLETDTPVQVRGGAEIRYSSDDRELVDALHQWFDAQRDGVASDAPAKTPSIMAAH